MATISKSHKINQASKPILENLLPLSHFALRPLIPDYHVDYFVELVENDDPSGIYFGIQLKGTEKLIFKKNQIKFKLKSKHLRYYLDNVKTLPIYVIVVDIINKKAYWLFVQKYLKESILNKAWRNQKDVSVYINLENVINNLEDFRKTIIEANNYMKELWPSSIRASAKKEKEYLQNLDPRFSIKSISVDDKNVNYNIEPNETVKLNFQIKNGIRFQEYLNNPDRDKIILKSSDVNVSGSDLFKEILKKTDNIVFSLKTKIAEVKVLLLIQENTDSFSDIIHLDGKLSFHKSYFKLDCTQHELPLKIRVNIDINESNKPNFNFNFDFTNWINKPIQFLPYLDKLDTFFAKIKEGKRIVFKVEFMGNPLMHAILNMTKYTEFLNFTDDYFSLCKKLKIIDLTYNLNLIFPGFDKINMEEVYDIEMLFDLLTSKEHVVKNKNLTINVSIINDKKLYERFKNGGDIRLISDYNFTILGKTFLVERIALDISRPKFLISDSEFLELLNSDKEFIPLKFTTDENSKIFYRKLEPAS